MQRRIDPSSERAIYRQLADILRQKIASGEWEAGRNLPAEADLGHEYGVSQASVRRALVVLRNEGLVVRQRGRVAAVAEPQEPKIVRFKRGDKARICFRNATVDEQRQHEVDEDTLMMVIEENGKERVRPVRGTEIEIGGDDD